MRKIHGPEAMDLRKENARIGTNEYWLETPGAWPGLRSVDADVEQMINLTDGDPRTGSLVWLIRFRRFRRFQSVRVIGIRGDFPLTSDRELWYRGRIINLQ